METKEWLGRGRNLRLEIEALVSSRAEALYLSKLGDGEKYLYELSELEKNINQRILALYRILAEISAAVEQVEEPLLRALLTERYVNGKGWEQVAEAMNYDIRWLYRLHKKALGQVEKVIVKS